MEPTQITVVERRGEISTQQPTIEERVARLEQAVIELHEANRHLLGVLNATRREMLR